MCNMQRSSFIIMVGGSLTSGGLDRGGALAGRIGVSRQPVY